MNAETIKKLEALAFANGMRFLAHRGQYGIGYKGQLAMEVVYSPKHGKSYDRISWEYNLRSRKLADQMFAIVNG